MKTKIQIKSIFGKVLFEYETENNSIKKTVQEANLGGADLSGANLRGANLGGADLGGADLGGANLRGADLGGADLREANLRGADLGGADLREANLGGADLWGADLWGADLWGLKNTKTAYLPIYSKWDFAIHGDRIKIGCKEKTIDEWDKWFSGTEEFETKRDTETFKRIQAHYEAYKAYYNFMKDSP